MAKVLVTGAAGLIGSHIVRVLLDRGHQVVSVDDLSGGLIENLTPDSENHFFCQKNLVDDIGIVFDIHKPEIVINCAALATEGASHFRKRYIFQNNLEIAVNILNCSVNYNVKKIVHLSSMAVYGGWKQPPFDETDNCIPEDTYGNAKLAIERELKITLDFFNKPEFTIIRPHNVIGIGQNIFDKYRNVIGIWIRKGLNGEPIAVYGDGLQMRAFSNVKDTAPAIVNAAFSDECNGEIINVGGLVPYKIMQAADILHSHFPDSKIEHLEQRFEVKHAWCTTEKSQRMLGYRDTVSLEDGIGEMVEWAKTLDTREVKDWKNEYEITEKLYSYWK